MGLKALWLKLWPVMQAKEAAVAVDVVDSVREVHGNKRTWPALISAALGAGFIMLVVGFVAGHNIAVRGVVGLRSQLNMERARHMQAAQELASVQVELSSYRATHPAIATMVCTPPRDAPARKPTQIKPASAPVESFGFWPFKP